MKKSLLLTALLLLPAPSRAAEALTPRPPQLASIISPEVHLDRTVTFRVRAANATNVTVSGEWPDSSKAMAKGAAGVWTTTLGPLSPGLYGYGFTVDGFRTLDPGNAAVKPMRSPTTSILEVPGERPSLFDFQKVPHGVVRLHEYESRSLGRRRSLRVYTPPGYDAKRWTRYPVLYLLHGSGDNEATWTVLGRAHFVADNLIEQRKAAPMLIVMADGHAAPPKPGGTNAAARSRNMAAFEGDLLQDIIPFVEKNYRAKSGRQHRAIIGLSMGGGQSLTVGLKHPELFAWVGGMSSAVSEPETTLREFLSASAVANQKLALLWFACGKEDFLLKRNQELDALLSERGIRHEFHETPGNHSWPVWRRYLVDFMPRIFLKN